MKHHDEVIRSSIEDHSTHHDREFSLHFYYIRNQYGSSYLSHDIFAHLEVNFLNTKHPETNNEC